MPPRVDFYVSEDAGADTRLRLACRVAEKAYHAGHKVVVLCEVAQLSRFDELLWTFGEGSFVPHDTVSDANLPGDAPVTLTTGPLPAGHTDLLINLAAGVPAAFGQFARIAEFLDARPEVRAAGRERFKVYRGHSIEPATHKV